MKKVCLLLLLCSISLTTYADLSDDELSTLFGGWDQRNGIWEDQWDYYSPMWAETIEGQAYGDLPDNWEEFRNDNWVKDEGTSEAYDQYENFVNSQVEKYVAENGEYPGTPINGGLGFLLLASIALGAYQLTKKI